MDFGIFSSTESLSYVFDGLGWFIGAFILASVWTAYLTVVADLKFIFRFIAIPTWLIFTIGLMVTVDSFSGNAYPGIPPKSQVIAFRIIAVTKEDETAKIEAWMYLTKQQKTRLYRFLHTPDREEALRKALKSRRNGRQVEIDFSKEGTAKTGELTDPENMLDYQINHVGLPRKAEDEDQSSQQIEQKQSLPVEDPVDDKFFMKLPGGGIIEIKRGSTVTVSPTGEIEIGTPKIETQTPQTYGRREQAP